MAMFLSIAFFTPDQRRIFIISKGYIFIRRNFYEWLFLNDKNQNFYRFLEPISADFLPERGEFEMKKRIRTIFDSKDEERLFNRNGRIAFLRKQMTKQPYVFIYSTFSNIKKVFHMGMALDETDIFIRLRRCRVFNALWILGIFLRVMTEVKDQKFLKKKE